jgi:hypothetical protein
MAPIRPELATVANCSVMTAVSGSNDGLSLGDVVVRSTVGLADGLVEVAELGTPDGRTDGVAVGASDGSTDG